MIVDNYNLIYKGCTITPAKFKIPLRLIKTRCNFYRWLQIEIQDAMPIIKFERKAVRDCELKFIKFKLFVGIDDSKLTLDVACLSSTYSQVIVHHVFYNDENVIRE